MILKRGKKTFDVSYTNGFHAASSLHRWMSEAARGSMPKAAMKADGT